MSIKKTEHTPLMQQYHEIRAQYPDALLLFQVGDFYELFFEDAKNAAAFLGIALTARGKNKGEPIPLCGVPVHALDHYLTKLVKGGFKVAICNQLEQPKPGTVVRRGVTQVLTPGTLTDSKLLDDKSASYLFSFFPAADSWGLLFGELLTAQLHATIIPVSSERILESELVRFFPDEILLPSTKLAKPFESFFKKRGYCITVVNECVDEDQEINTWINEQFKQQMAQKIQGQDSLRLAMHYFYAYMKRNQCQALEQFNSIAFYKADDFLRMDGATQRNLELVKNVHDGTVKNTLFSVVDRAVTSMGSRMIKKWLMRPLIKQEAIEQRQDTIELFVAHGMLIQEVQQLMAQVGDIERVVGRIALNRAQLHDYSALTRALTILPELKALLSQDDHFVLLKLITHAIGDFHALHQLLTASLNDDSTQDWIIKKGFDEQLDILRDLVCNSNQKIIALERHEQEKTKIQSLKIRYNQVHGYYIEVTKANAHLVPESYTRQQTLVGKERYMTPELQQLQGEIVRANNEIGQVEKAVFERVKKEVIAYIAPLRKLAHSLAYLDALISFSYVAYNFGYVRPIFNNDRKISIIDGRHPLIEQTSDGSFIPNDTQINDDASLWIITGPNMGGKSTYLRQVALNCILAQCGSFVPAKSADLAILDRVFTRIGAGDNLAQGKSTFLVEMEETAAICTQATENSLVILDEVGRGTSTFDGLAIAQAVVEYIYNQVKARCLFATHYHELTQLESQYGGIVSYYAASKKTNNGIVFLYKIIRGVADGSFGVEVAKLAELPDSVINRAQELLHVLAPTGKFQNVYPPNLIVSGSRGNTSEVSLVQQYEQLMNENKKLKLMQQESTHEIKHKNNLVKLLADIDYDELSPKKAFDLLWQVKEYI